MAKNDLIRQRKLRDQVCFDAGERVGIQKMWDYMQLALRDPETMGRDVFGKARLEKVYKKTYELGDYYAKAFSTDVEADVRQEELDRQLHEIWEDELAPFRERYPELKTFSYDKAKKGWVD